MLHDRKKIMSFLWDIEGNKKISGWWKDCLFGIYELIDSYQEKNSIKGNLGEIGIYRGRSLIPFINFKRDDKVFAMDIDEESRKVSNLIKTIYPNDHQDVEITIGDSKNTNPFESNGPFRMFYVDGDHKYESALNDLIIASKVLSDKGVIFIDDYENPRYGKDVTRAINYFLKNNTKFELGFCTCQTAWIVENSETDNLLKELRTLSNWNESVDPTFNVPLFLHKDGMNLK